MNKSRFGLRRVLGLLRFVVTIFIRDFIVLRKCSGFRVSMGSFGNSRI